MGMAMSFLHVVSPQLPPRKTSQNEEGGTGEGGNGDNQAMEGGRRDENGR